MSSPSLREVHRHIVSSVPLALFIDNKFVQPLRNGRMSVVDPADESVITTQVPAATSEDVDLAVAAAARAFKTWGKTTGACVFIAVRRVAACAHLKRACMLFAVTALSCYARLRVKLEQRRSSLQRKNACFSSCCSLLSCGVCLHVWRSVEAVNSGKAKPEAEWDVDDVAGCFEYCKLA